ncbi:MAG TPA: FlgO family outer membrane protein [Puia sp.]|nr:FlgO family outer membrane protein [Puia sp.]
MLERYPCTQRSALYFFLLMVLLASANCLGQQNDLNQVASSLARDINAGNRHIVTVADFTDLQGKVTELGRFISEELSTRLVIDAKNFNVVERIQLAAILKEHQISISGLVDPATIRKLGQFAGVDAIVTGTFVPFSDSVRLTAKVLDVSTARVMAVSTAELPRTKAIDDLLSRGIATGSGPNNASSGGTTHPSNPTKIFSVEQNEFMILLKTCSPRGDRVVCSGSITNKANRARHFQIMNGSTSAIDNNGNSYAANQADIGQGVATDLMPDLPTNFHLDFPGVDSAATSLNVIFAYLVDNINFTKALFRNLPLPAK